MVSLCDYVRGALHFDDDRCGDANWAVFCAGGFGVDLEAVG